MAMTGGTAKLVKEEYADYGNGNWTIKLYVYYKTSQDNTNNRSIVTVGMYVVTPSGYDIGTWTDFSGSYVGNSSLTFDGTIPNFSGTRWLVENKTFPVNHNSDGTGTATIYWKWGVRSSWGGYYEPSGSFTITLPTIPRASSITTATNKTLGDACSIKWTPASSSFTYKLKFKLGNWDYTTGTISPKTISAYTYTAYKLPLEVADELPNATSGTMTVYLYTYRGSTQIGSTAMKTFTVTVPSNIKPSISNVSATLVNSNSVINGWGIAVAGYTKVKITAAASGSHSSKISSFTISGGYSTTQNGTSLDYTGAIISSSGSKTFTVVAKDSRGRLSDSKSATPITFYAYSKPTVSSFTVARSSSNAREVVVKANWTFSSVNNKNAATATLQYKKSSNTSWTTYGTIAKNTDVTLTNEFEETSSYNFRVVVTDSLSNSAQEEGFISTIEVIMDFRAGGKGLGIGKIAETDNLEIGFDTHIMNGKTLYGRDILNNPINIFQPCDSSGNLVIGLGYYANSSGNTNIYGNKINLYTREGLFVDNVLFSNLYYKPGDKITYRNNTAFSAFVTSDSSVIFLSIPILRPTIGVTTDRITFKGKLQGRGINGYLLNPADKNSIYDLDSPNGFSYKIVNFSGGIITLALIFESALNIRNNTPATIVPDGNFIVTLS